MSNYIYKCIPVPTIIDTGTTGKNMHENAVKSYESIINNIAKEGWELEKIDTVSSMQNPGCLGQLIGLFTGGAKSEIQTFKLLIFKKLATSNQFKSNQTEDIAIYTKAESRVKRCNQCNNIIEEHDTFCENCGNKLN